MQINCLCKYTHKGLSSYTHLSSNIFSHWGDISADQGATLTSYAPALRPVPQETPTGECLLLTFTHLTVIVWFFHYHRTNLTWSCLELLVRDTQVLYTDFSASRQRRLLAFPRCVQVATPIPNLDSAATLNRRFYYSSDPHATFVCDN